jgi:hypothetical protein
MSIATASGFELPRAWRIERYFANNSRLNPANSGKG